MKRSRNSQYNEDLLEEAAEQASSESAHKITGLDTSAIIDDNGDYSSSLSSITAMRCTLPPHKEPLAFRSYADYDAHYNKEHAYRCAECHKNLPSAHYLGLHFEECHDPFAAVKRDKGEHTYSCYAEDCDRKCATPQKRRMHAIDKHMFPKNYFFAVTKEGIDGRASLLLGSGHHRRSSSAATATIEDPNREGLPVSPKRIVERNGGHSRKPSNKTETSSGIKPKERPDVDMDDLAGAMSSLQFVPPNIRFGRSGKKAGFARK